MKDRTVCKSCYNKNRRKNNDNTIIENEIYYNNNKNTNTIVSTYENHANVVIGPRDNGKIFTCSKYLKK